MIGTTNEKNRKDWLEKTLTKIPINFRILDAGAGELANKVYCQHLQYFSQDFCQYSGIGDTKGLQMNDWDTTKIDIVSDITSIPESDSTFDVILCSEVLEHIPNPVKALEEFHRLLKVNGQLILTAPFCSLTHFAPYHFSSGFNRYFYTHHLESMGFQIQEITPNGNYFEYIAQEIRRLPSVIEKYSKGKASILLRFSIKLLLKMIKYHSTKSNDSNELLCFGYHVIAIKK
jgi:SAM-dependent methyltransferase